jgi:hypothetical protein
MSGIVALILGFVAFTGWPVVRLAKAGNLSESLAFLALAVVVVFVGPIFIPGGLHVFL